MTLRNTPSLCFIGFGEAGQALASGLREAGVHSIAAWDILFPEADGERLKAAGQKIGVRLATSAADAVRGSDMIVSAVTAASSLAAAQSVKPHLGGQVYLDINSVSPGRKQEIARELAGAARYVDVAVMAPVHPAPPDPDPVGRTGSRCDRAAAGRAHHEGRGGRTRHRRRRRHQDGAA